ncbi:MAG: hypothetical protein HQL11_05565, partial [Candidatus Omnitrophica bacterium]|nr:hypothetical protein [Candidatus Omnitrophota bacterium]
MFSGRNLVLTLGVIMMIASAARAEEFVDPALRNDPVMRSYRFALMFHDQGRIEEALDEAEHALNL